MPLAPGEVFAGYRVLRQIGHGGMGDVYLVQHPRLPRRDALKLLNRDLSNEGDFKARFLREADVVAALAHRNIVSIYDRGEESGQLWLTMRYVDGIDVEAALYEAGGLFPASRAVHIITEVAAALDAAHRQNLIHRDVKPANILVCGPEDDEAEQVFLTDFGIAKSLDAGNRLTRTGLVVATFDYASPEQIEARPLDSRSDVYSLACVFYKLLTGSVPFPGEQMLAAAAGHLGSPPPRPTALAPWLAPAVDDVVARAMAKNPADRFPTCRALAAAAAKAVDELPAAPPPPYRMFLSRTENGASSGPQIGPVRTDRMAHEEIDRLVALVRRTRFFDLPERLSGAAPARRNVTIEIGCTGRAHRVVADLDDMRRPPELDDLISTIETVSATQKAGPTSATAVTPVAPPTQRHALPPIPRHGTPPADRVGAAAHPPSSRFAAPPPALPAAPVPLHPSPGQGAEVGGQGPEAYAGQGGERHLGQTGFGGSAAPPLERGTPSPAGAQPGAAEPFWPWPPAGAPEGTPAGQPPGGWGPPPGGPEPLWRPPPEQRPPSHRSRNLLIALVVALLVAGAVTTWFLLRDTSSGGGGSSGSGANSSAASTSPARPMLPTAQARAAWAALPRTATPLSDATMVVTKQQTASDFDLFLVDATTGAVGTQLTGSPERDLAALISPERKSVVYIRTSVSDPNLDEIRVVAADGSGDRPLFPKGLTGCVSPTRPAWNPVTPTELAVACGDNPDKTSLRIISLDGVMLRELPAPAHVDDLAFSPDGSQLAFWGSDSPRATSGNLYTVATDGTSDPSQITSSDTDVDPVWGKHGQIAFSRAVGAGGRQREIYVINPANSEATPLTRDGAVAQGPSWSPDGSLLAFKSNRGGGSNGVWVMDANGADIRPIAAGVIVQSTPAWGAR